MSKFKVFIEHFIYVFLMSTTLIVIFIPLTDIIFGNNNVMYTRNLLFIPLISFMTTLPTLIPWGGDSRKDSAVKLLFIRVLHFLITATMAFLSIWLVRVLGFPIANNAIITIIVFFAIYLILSLWFHIKAKRIAKQLNERINQRLNAFHDNENATHKSEH